MFARRIMLLLAWATLFVAGSAFAQAIDKRAWTNPFPMAKCNGVDIDEISIDGLQALMSSGALNSTTLVECYMSREAQVRNLGAVIEFNPDALSIAAGLDAERANGTVRGPLHGIPLLVKDNIATADKMQTCAGALALLGNIVPRDAFVISKLRAAGVVVLAKANLAEWADIRASDYSEGYSGRGGQTRNAFNLTQNPGGSSSGSAHGVSANIAPIAIGTETDGSVIGPAARAGIIGIKPTRGLTSRSGVIPESGNQDTVGCFGKTVRDAVYCLDAMYGIDPLDNVTSNQMGKTPSSYTAFLSNKTALDGVHLGIPWERLWTAPSTIDQLPALLETLKVLESAGVKLYNNTNLPSADDILDPAGWDWEYEPPSFTDGGSEFDYVSVDFYNNLATYLAGVSNTSIRSLPDVVAYNLAHPNETCANGCDAFASGQDVLLACNATGGVQGATYYKALLYQKEESQAGGIDAALAPPVGSFYYYHGHPLLKPLEALLMPSDPFSASTEPAAKAGYPMIQIPIGIDGWDVPIGLSLVGTAYSEPELIRIASAIEDLLKPRVSVADGGLGITPLFYNPNATNIPIDNNFGIGDTGAYGTSSRRRSWIGGTR